MKSACYMFVFFLSNLTHSANEKIFLPTIVVEGGHVSRVVVGGG
jgi:hypothetical protein